MRELFMVCPMFLPVTKDSHFCLMDCNIPLTNSDLNMVMGRAYFDVVVEECFSSSFYFV